MVPWLLFGGGMAETHRASQLDKAVMGIRSLIMAGELEPNVRLAEVALAERLEISRTPLRQAMDRLVAEGLLERIDTGGCRVASFTQDDIIDAIELRGVIEGTAARLAAERGANVKVLGDCDRVLEQLDRAMAGQNGIDFPAYVRLNAEFHCLIGEMSGSAVMRREAQRVVRLPLASPSAFLQGQEFIPDFQASLRRAHQQHHAIVDAIRNREGTRAEALAREHARLARSNLEHILQSDRGLKDRVPGFALLSIN